MANLGYYILRFKEYDDDIINFLINVNARLIMSPRTQSNVFIVPLDVVTSYDFASIKVRHRDMESEFISGKEPSSDDVYAELQKLSTPQQKINFLLFLLYKHFKLNEQENSIFKRCLFTQIKNLVDIKNNTEVFDTKLHQISENLIIPGLYNAARYRREFENLGIYSSKNQDPEIMLRNGMIIKFSEIQTYANAVPSKFLEILHGIVISKIDTMYDFSSYVVNGSFICNNPKTQIIFPAKVYGTLSLTNGSFCGISIQKIPNGTTSVNLTNTVTSFESLNKIEFPDTVTKVVVSHSLLNKATKDPLAVEFYTSHKNIMVIDERGYTLQLALESKHKEQPNTPIKESTPAQTPKPVVNIPVKNGDDLTRADLEQLLLNDAEFIEQLRNIYPDYDLARLIKSVTPATKYQQKLHSSTNNILSICIPVTCILQVKKDILDCAVKCANHKQNNVITNTQTQQPEIGQQLKSSRIRNQRKSINKYIPTSVFKLIAKACGDDKNKLYTLLSTVNQINADYSKKAGERAIVHISKDGTITAVPNIETRAGCACTQRLPDVSNKGAARIVWTIQGNKMVAIAFYADHSDNNDERDYNTIALPNAQKGCLIDGTDISDVNLDERDAAGNPKYLKVKDLLPMYKPREKAPKPEPQTVAVPQEPTPAYVLTPGDLYRFNVFYNQIQFRISSINHGISTYICQPCADSNFITNIYKTLGTICLMYSINNPKSPQITQVAYNTKTRIAGSRSGYSSDYKDVKRRESTIQHNCSLLEQMCKDYYTDSYKNLPSSKQTDIKTLLRRLGILENTQ